MSGYAEGENSNYYVKIHKKPCIRLIRWLTLVDYSGM